MAQLQPVLFLLAIIVLRCHSLPTDSDRATPTQNDKTPPAPETTTTRNAFRSYLQNPTDFTTILLIIGGDIVQKALAQLSGSRLGAPIAFSFGWVSYSFSALASVVGDGRLMPAPEFPSLVVSTSNGYVRNNGSWVLTRLLRDLEHKAPKRREGLRVTIMDATSPGGVPRKDWVWYIGTAVIPTQFAISLVPWILRDNWSIFLLTFSGTLLAFSASLMPQWSAEKWCCRRREACYVLTRGNGHRHMFVMRNRSPEGLHLEDMAASHVYLSASAEWSSRVVLTIIAICWLIFIICAGALETDIWFLLAIGFLGMLQNIVVAGATRSPWAHGINVKEKEVIEGKKVMKVLQDVEYRYPGVGLSMLNVFFPGDLRPEEDEFWDDRKMEVRAHKGNKTILEKDDPISSRSNSGCEEQRMSNV